MSYVTVIKTKKNSVSDLPLLKLCHALQGVVSFLMGECVSLTQKLQLPTIQELDHRMHSCHMSN